MVAYTVSFFGHRQLNCLSAVEKCLEDLIGQLLREHEYVVFLVGRNGEFDQAVSSAVRRAKHIVREDNSTHILVLPYETAEVRNNRKAFLAYYDEIEVCEAATKAHYKSAIQVRNKQLVDRSDLVIFYVENERGGAYQTLKYAEKQGIHIINIAKKAGDGISYGFG